MDDPWLGYRRETPGAESVAHFNNAGAALMPRPVIDAVKAHIDLEARCGGYEAAHLRADAIAEVYRHGAALIGARPENIALTANATDSYARALSAIAFERGDVIIASWSEYASNQIQLVSLARRFGVEIVQAPKREDGAGADLQALEALIAKRRPKLVASVHINTSSGFIEDVAGIGAVCRRHDVHYLVDACQSAGQMPIDVEAIGCDFLSATSRKFVRGPRGAGMLYVSDRALDAGLEPLFIDLRGAMLMNEREYAPAPTAKRFEDWEFSYAALLGFGAAAKYALEIGLDRIEARLRDLNNAIRSRIAGQNRWRAIDRGDPVAPIIPICAEGLDGPATQRAMAAAGVNVSLLPAEWAPMDRGLAEAGWALRVSPHYYNNAADIDRLFQALEEAARG